MRQGCEVVGKYRNPGGQALVGGLERLVWRHGMTDAWAFFATGSVLPLEVTLLGTRSMIRRRLLVPESMPMHEVLQAVDSNRRSRDPRVR